KKALAAERRKAVGGGATGALVDRLLEENPDMDLEEAIAIAKTGTRYTKLETPTDIRLINKAGGGDARVLPKDVAEAERQKTIGRETGEGQMALPKARSALDGYEIKNRFLLGDEETKTTGEID